MPAKRQRVPRKALKDLRETDHQCDRERSQITPAPARLARLRQDGAPAMSPPCHQSNATALKADTTDPNNLHHRLSAKRKNSNSRATHVLTGDDRPSVKTFGGGPGNGCEGGRATYAVMRGGQVHRHRGRHHGVRRIHENARVGIRSVACQTSKDGEAEETLFPFRAPLGCVRRALRAKLGAHAPGHPRMCGCLVVLSPALLGPLRGCGFAALGDGAAVQRTVRGPGLRPWAQDTKATWSPSAHLRRLAFARTCGSAWRP